MRILVVSDTHRDFSALHHAVQTQPKAEIVLHLGDGEEELMQIKPMFPEKMIVGVRETAILTLCFPGRRSCR